MKELELTFRSRDLNKNVTIREYFVELLTALWDEKEGFNGKRPFGNSSWEYEIFECLVINKIIPGTIDEDGYVDKFDRDEGNKFVFKLIAAMNHPEKGQSDE